MMTEQLFKALKAIETLAEGIYDEDLWTALGPGPGPPE